MKKLDVLWKVGAPLIILIVVTFLFHPNVRNMKITEKNHAAVMRQIEYDKDLSPRDVRLVQTYEIRAKSEPGRVPEPIGMTIGEIIETELQYETAMSKRRGCDPQVPKARSQLP